MPAKKKKTKQNYLDFDVKKPYRKLTTCSSNDIT